MSTKKIQVLGSVLTTDETLTQPGVAADSKTVGGKLANINAQLTIDYNAMLAFDTTEIVFGTNTSAILGQAILGQMVLA